MKVNRTFSLSDRTMAIIDAYAEEMKLNRSAAAEEIIRQWKNSENQSKVVAYYDAIRASGEAK